MTLCVLLVGVRLILGLTDKTETRWDGSVAADRARITAIDPWRFEGADAVLNGSSWRLSTHPIRLFGGQQAAQRPVVANGVIVWLAGEDENAELRVTTAQGNFTVRLRDIAYGRIEHALDGRVMADRIPPAMRITSTPDEQDYPAAAADKSGNVWLAYLEFKHHPDHDRIRANLREAPKDFSDYKAAPGGDQILVRKYSQGAWSEPLAITPPGGDLYRPAIAVDGTGRPWVFWPANEKGNFDLWARAIENGQPGRTLRLSNAPGSDIDPAATTDAKGNVWVAWQGWRDGRAIILAANQQGNAFSRPATASSSTANEWNPAIAADDGGRVTVAWDSYRHGNYDIYARTATAPGRWDKEFRVAVSARYEAYPSAAYDREGRLWVAYEEGGEGWGKDFGAQETTGLALYQGRAVRLIGFDRGGRPVNTAGDLGAVLPGVPEQRVDSAGRQNGVTDWITPDPDNARKRGPSRTAVNVRSPKNTLPRLGVDASGRLWLAFRSMHPIWWNPIGTVWTEYVASCDGAQWTGPIFLAHTDNLLDNRPALVSTRAGELLVIGSSDWRRQFHLSEKFAKPQVRRGAETVPDPYQNDLYANLVSLPPASGQFAVRSGAAPGAPAPALDPAGPSAAAALRNFRLKTRSGNLRLIRGEFHRHSEISMDGGNDGTILDQWRYMFDPGAMDWVGCCDHDNGGGREYSWWITQKLTDIFYTPGKFVPLFSYERSVPYPEGHRNVVMAQRGVRPLPRLPRVKEETPGPAPDTQMFYAYLRAFDGIVAMHTSGTNMGTDWRDNDPNLEPVVEIYQGIRQNYEMPGAPRANTAADSIGGWRPKGFINLALEMGYKMAFQSSSDHVSTHMSYCNVYATAATREALMDAFKKRHVYGATDNILAVMTSGGHMMGDAFSTAQPPELRVKLTGTAPFAKVHVIKDNKYVYSIEPKEREVAFTWRDSAPQRGKTSYYYVRGEQEDGEIVWVSPMWITYR
ncbi:MAG: hypothetical protein AAB225_18350 [Acidobacteriota bacterium]